MSKRYPGNFITGNPVALSQTSNTGVWDLKDNYQATNNNTWQESDGIYEISKSLRFRASASAYFSKVPSTSGNRNKFTLSMWVKWTGQGAQLFSVTSGVGTSTQEDNRLSVEMTSSGGFNFYELASASFASQKYSAAAFRDPSAWYHLIVAVDYTQASGNDRIKMYVNGVQLSSFSATTTPAQNLTSYISGSGNGHYIGGVVKYYTAYYDGHVTEFNYIDGQQLDPSYFGYTDSITGIWQPKPYTGTYGTNGFYLPFSDNNSLTNLGRNFAGSNYLSYSSDFTNASYWTLSGVTNGTANSATAPDGTSTAYKIKEKNTGTGFHYTFQSITLTSGVTYTMSCYAKAAERSIFYFDVSQGLAGVYFDLANAKVGTQSSGYVGSMQFIGNGWYRCSVTFTASATGTWYFQPGTSTGDGVYSYLGTNDFGLYIWGPSYNIGSTPDTYISTTAQIKNDWTPNNFSLTAGATYDSMVDSPTNVFTTATDTGGVVPGNYATVNSLVRGPSNYSDSPTPNLTNGNLTINLPSGTGYGWHHSSLAVPASGYWYAEIAMVSGTYNGANNNIVGVTSVNNPTNMSGLGLGFSTGTYGYWDGDRTTGTFRNNSTTSQSVAGFTTGDTLMVALGNGNLWFGKNGTWLGTGSPNPSTGTSPAYTGLSGDYFFSIVNYTSPYGYTSNVNFGNRPFTYTPPTGFKSLNTTNLQALGTTAVAKTAIQANKWFDANLYGGFGTTQKITNAGGFQPDLVWVKSRSNATYNHILVDSVRGAGNILSTDLTSAEGSAAGYWITGLETDGFTLGSAGANGTNASGSSYVGWQWKQSPQSGFNIVTYSGSGTRTISHNLGVAPSMIILKGRNVTDQWTVGHAYLNGGVNPWNYGLPLNGTATLQTNSTFWNNTAPTSSSFTVGSWDAGYNMVAYLWAEVPGFSKFGSYTGNGSTDGPFIYTGFRPKFVMMKVASGTTHDWVILDSARNTANWNSAITNVLFANTADAESSGWTFDFVSNGIKIRYNGRPNNSGDTYIYAAFAESPFGLNNRAR
jgi:hypothetical protein